jgi:hypothetical protein
MYTGFWWGDLMERFHLKDLGVDGKIILKWVFNKWGGDIDWVDMVRDSGHL